VQWLDMVRPERNGNFTDDMMGENMKDEKSLTVSALAAFVKDPPEEGLELILKGDEYRNRFPWIKQGKKQSLAVFPPEKGQEIQILGSAGNTLFRLHRYAGAEEAYKQAIAIYPNDAYAHNGLGNALSALGRGEEAVLAYQQSILLDRRDSYPYYGLGNSLAALGRKEEAILAFQKSISLSDAEDDIDWIEIMEKKIKKLKKQK
jgi:tetratricopeptide (TPR) repeat protein